MEIGICTFADVGTHPITKETVTPHQRLRNLMEEIQLADELGLDVFAVGEHHRSDYAISSPAVVLAAAAERTKAIKLSSGVTVLSSDDPVRVFQQFSTVDLLSNGRAEIMAGRGSFIESFPLFGYKLEDYDELFSEKLEMLVRINESEKITWQGKHTQTINDRGVYPRPSQNKLPVWVAVGGTPESVVRAAQYGLPMMLAIIGGMPARFAPYAKLYRDVYAKAGHNANGLQLGINSHTYIADTSQQARDEFYPPYSEVMTRIGKERGWPGMSRGQFDASTEREGALLVGSPQQVIDKILYEHELFGHTRFLAQMSIGALPHGQALRSIELLGTKVAPEVKKALATKSAEQG
ncbi:LLM class flavin-dependent oxidoreductase [Flavisolibacter ginsenosidimutans]|uniref:LLM class flavin-dependent oxidoreductase n=1 Tax=Flavisolibacter ginsenosidimutans TaxID=661481 RepID=A0A5B8UJP8_9BACT|nr:LLM class flavin-dependent oxidoreductase [Flavisolibacter ginsenosidimutans]QEC56798.1 LLM class flavin-dependent oxidoreductase [Flavisolibacter ginsenosidimutans]